VPPPPLVFVTEVEVVFVALVELVLGDSPGFKH